MMAQSGAASRFVEVASIAILIAMAFAVLPTPAARGEDRKGARAAPVPKRATPDAGAAATATVSAASPPSLPGAVDPSDAGVVAAKTLDGGTRVFTFSELDIEGRLKSPQLVYFLRRMRAEFATRDLGHRTFLREMSETRKEPSF